MTHSTTVPVPVFNKDKGVMGRGQRQKTPAGSSEGSLPVLGEVSLILPHCQVGK